MIGPIASPCWALLVALCLLWNTRVTKAGFERYCNTDRHMQRNKGICGHHLSNILSTVCRMYNKRDSPSGILPDLSVHDDQDTSMLKDTNIFLPKQEALAVFKRGLRVSGTITCECCVHRCGIMELRQYCSEVEPLKRTEETLDSPEDPEPVVTTEEPVDVTTKAPEEPEQERLQPEHEDVIDEHVIDEPQRERKLYKDRESLHIAQKRRIGAAILRKAPTWWESMNEMAAYLANGLDVRKNRVPQTHNHNM